MLIGYMFLSLASLSGNLGAQIHYVNYYINYEPQGRFSSPEPNMFGGDAGTSPGERPHDVIAGESPARRDFPR